MHGPSEEQQKSKLWIFFFIYSGFMCLVYWNFILNLILYIELKVGKGFFIYFTFSYASANITYFVTGRHLFKKLDTKRALIISILISSVFFYISLLLTEFLHQGLFKQIILLIIIFIYAYFTGCFQGRISGFGSACGAFSINAYSLGTGISGFGSNLIAIFFYFLFDFIGTKDIQVNLQRQMISYLVVLPLLFIFYMLTLFIFLKKYGHFVNYLDIELKKKEEEGLLNIKSSTNTQKSVKTMKTFTSWQTVGSERKYSAFSILKRIIDIWFAKIFTYYITIQSVTFFLPNLAQKYDNNGEIYILVYILLYNTGDTLGKSIPNSYMIKNSFYIHIIASGRIIFQIYFMILIYTTPIEVFSHYALRGAVFLIIGVSNGYLTNNCLGISPKRFRNIKNRDYSGYFMIFALIIGVTSGTFGGVLWGL